MVKDRVEYFESNDLMYGYNLDKIETISIRTYDSININDAIEFYEIKKYFDDGVRSKNWTDEEYKSYIQKSKILFSLTMRFFNEINDTSIINKYELVEHSYHKAFWSLFNLCKLFNIITEPVFENLIFTVGIPPFEVFSQRNIVKKYGNALRRYVLENEFSINILIHFYEQDSIPDSLKLYLPKELTGNDVVNYIESYINSECPDTNVLISVFYMQHTEQFPIDDVLRLKAKRRYDQESKKIFEKGTIFSQGIHLSLIPDQIEEKTFTQTPNGISVSYSINWLLETLDYPSILNNFIYIFEFVDYLQMRCDLVSKPCQADILERTIKSQSIRIYPDYYTFNFLNGLADMQISAYYNFLKQNKIRLEDVLKWFFTTYLQDEFKCPEMRVSFPSEDTTFSEKCSSITTALESVIKQFSLLVNLGEIDFELLEISTTSEKIENIPSFIKNKYIYGVGKEFSSYVFWLFSDQCTFSFVDRIHKQNKEYDTLFDLLKHEAIFLSDYEDAERVVFERLCNDGLLSITADGLISLGDRTKLTILKDLNDNQVISSHHYSLTAQNIIESWVEKGVLVERCSLLSLPETHYFNYILNNSEYDNGLALRNKYSHGNQQVIVNEKEHESNYYTLLKIIIILVIKINDDFLLKDRNDD